MTTRSRVLMGTGVQLQVLGGDPAAAAEAAEAALGRMAEIESLLSRYRSDSDFVECEGYLLTKDLEVVRTSGFGVV
jgi:thiamine biosynthesis lipoprotein ApbE